MDKLKLPPRLAAVARMVPPGSRVADVGTDHALLPIWLLKQGIALAAIASDIRPGPLAAAERNRLTYGVSELRCILSDGLDAIGPEEADTVIIAGMGGETIATILRWAPWTHRDVTLLLQPMSRPEVLRRALAEMGVGVREERLVEDADRLYSVLLARGGACVPATEAELLIGRYALLHDQVLFLPWLEHWEKKLCAALKGMELAADPALIARREEYELLLDQLAEMRRKRDAEGT